MRDSDIRDLLWSETSKYGTIIHYKRKLAAEREASQKLILLHREAVDKCNEARQQLAAAVEGLQRISQNKRLDGENWETRIADAALAKIGDKP